MQYPILITLQILFLVTTPVAAQGRLVLDDGRELRGQVLAVYADGCAFQAHDMSEPSRFAWGRIGSDGVRTESPLSIRLINGDRVTGMLIAKPGGLTVQSEFMGQISLQLADLPRGPSHAALDTQDRIQDIALELTQEEERQTILDPTDWTGKIALLGTFRQGNVDSTLFQFNAGVNRQWAEDRFSAEAGFAYGDTEGEATARNAFGRAKFDHFYDEDFYSYVNADVEWDEIQNLDLRAVLGVGIGLNTWRGEGDHRSLDFELGVAGIYEKYVGESSTFEFALRAAGAYLDVWGDNLLFTQKIEILMPVTDFGGFLLRSYTALEMNLLENWYLQNILQIDYDADPPADTESLDLQLLVGIEYKF